MTLKSLTNGAAVGAAGVLTAGLVIYYLGDLPIVKQAKDGLKGTVAGFGR